MPRKRTSLKGLSRRVFVHRLTFFGGGVILLGSQCKEDAKPSKPPAPEKKAKGSEALTTSHKTFTNEEWATLSAAVDRIIPRDEDPGALDANVPEYIDRMLQAQQLQRMKDDFTSGLAALDRRCQRMHKVGFAAATPEQRDEVLTLFKDSPERSGEAKWYEILLALTFEGFLGDPTYGGNKDHVGWKLVGFQLVGGVAVAPVDSYQGQKHLDSLRCGTKKGC